MVVWFLFPFISVRACKCVGDDDRLYDIRFGKAINSLILEQVCRALTHHQRSFFLHHSSFIISDCVHVLMKLIHWQVERRKNGLLKRYLLSADYSPIYKTIHMTCAAHPMIQYDVLHEM